MKKKLDCYDCGRPFSDEMYDRDGSKHKLWLCEVIHNGQVVGTISSNSKVTLKKYMARWLGEKTI